MNTNDTHTYLLIAALPGSPLPTERTWSHPRKIFDADCTTSYVLNSGVTESNLTKFLQGVQKWLPITLLKSKLRSSNSFGSANLTNEDCRNEDCRQIARFSSVNSKTVERKFTKFGHDVAWLLPLNLLKADLRSANPLSNAEANSKGRSTRRRLYNFLCQEDSLRRGAIVYDLTKWFLAPRVIRILRLCYEHDVRSSVCLKRWWIVITVQEKLEIGAWQVIG